MANSIPESNLKELENKIKDPLHRDLLTWYRENLSEKYITEKLLSLIHTKQDEVKES